MEIKIANNIIALHFGWDFLEQINNHFGFKVDAENDVEINTKSNGFPFMEMGLKSYDPISVVKVIQSATATEKSKPSKANIQKMVEEMLVTDPKAYKAFVDELNEEIKKDKLLQAMKNLQTK